MERLHFEDFAPGQVFELGTVTVDEEEMLQFSRRFDPQPIHLDAEAAAASIYGGVIASGWYTCSLFMRLFVDGVLGRAASLGSTGVEELRWRRPVRAGEVLSGRYAVVEVKPSSSRTDRGAVLSQAEMRRLDGEPVMTLRAWNHFARRPPIPPPR